jgi:hypothetical protein
MGRIVVVIVLVGIGLSTPAVGQRTPPPGFDGARVSMVDLVTPPLPNYPKEVLLTAFGCHAVNAGDSPATVRITIHELDGTPLPHGTIPETVDAPGPHCSTPVSLAPGQTCSAWSVVLNGGYCRISVSVHAVADVRGALVDFRTARVAEAR